MTSVGSWLAAARYRLSSAPVVARIMTAMKLLLKLAQKFIERFGARTELLERHVDQRRRHGVLALVQVRRAGLQVKQAGGHFALPLPRAHVAINHVAVGRIGEQAKLFGKE